MATPLVVGLSGLRPTDAERAFLRDARPVGVILFARNLSDAEGLRRIVGEVGEACDCLLFVDQEGGRVQRLRPPLAPRYPAAAVIGALHARDAEAGSRAAYLAGRLIGEDLAAYGLDTPCLPVADVTDEGTHDAIGDRAFSRDAAAVATLAGAAAEGVMAAGCLPIMKHVPGQGRARADSHLECPVVDASREALERDFQPFRALAGLPMAMTAHVRYPAIDPQKPATLSPDVLALVREEIGFRGLLFTDDIVMGALGPDRVASGRAALEAGCDVVLHCSGDLSEMEAMAASFPEMEAGGLARLEAALAARRAPDEADVAALREEFAALLAEEDAP